VCRRQLRAVPHVAGGFDDHAAARDVAHAARRILVGEVRGPEALDLLDAWNTGHEGGTATLHANNAVAGLARLRSLVTRHDSAPADIEPLIGEVVHVVVHIARTADGLRRVQAILEVRGYSDCRYLTKVL
jgi:Flp pilus assembly CpaF family ATPase